MSYILYLKYVSSIRKTKEHFPLLPFPGALTNKWHDDENTLHQSYFIREPEYAGIMWHMLPRTSKGQVCRVKLRMNKQCVIPVPTVQVSMGYLQ